MICNLRNLIRDRLLCHPYLRWLVRSYAIARQLAVSHTIKKVQAKFDRKANALQSKGVVAVWFVVVFDSVFHFQRLFELMVKDCLFDPYIVIAPMVCHGDAEKNRILQQAYRSLHEKFRSRVHMWNDAWCSCNSPDLCVFNNVYDSLTVKGMGIESIARKGVLTITSNYGCDTGTSYTNLYVKQPQWSYIWRYYSGTTLVKELLELGNPVLKSKGRVVLSGTPKMDFLIKAKNNPRTRKRIIICPHHSTSGSQVISLSNFESYKDLFLDLPKRYPQIDWVFRPHPLLPSGLKERQGWSDEDWDDYISRFCETSNAVYYPNGDCFEMFVNSDGMIQDCGSFLAEYHYTGHPQCYMLKSEQSAREQYLDFGLELLEHTYKAFSESDIVAYIENVVLKGNDWKKAARDVFVRERLCLNYPHVNEFILDDIKTAIGH